MDKWLKFGRWTTLWESMKKWNDKLEKCICECWTVKFVYSWHLKSWKSISCWCARNEMTTVRNKQLYTKHWMQKTRFYHIYQNAKYRATNPKAPNYSHYWERWIKFEWNSFEEFYNDMYESYLEHSKIYWEKDTTIERIDVNWNYCKSNCIWATNNVQQQNRTNTYHIEYNWKSYGSIMELSKDLWVKYSRVKYRLLRWMSVEKAISWEKYKPWILLNNQ